MSRCTSILLLGDGPGAAGVARRLGRHFLGVERARDCNEASDMAQRCRFHLLVLVDPEQPWRELRRALDDCAELPSATLLISGKPATDLVIDALRGGVTDVLLRPFSTEELVAAVNAICAKAGSPAQPGAAAAKRGPLSADYPLDWTLERVKRHHMARVLEDCGGNKSAAARRLDISRRTLDRKLGSSERDQGR